MLSALLVGPAKNKRKKNIVLMLWMRIMRMGRDQPGRDRPDSKNDPSLSHRVAVELHGSQSVLEQMLQCIYWGIKSWIF